VWYILELKDRQGEREREMQKNSSHTDHEMIQLLHALSTATGREEQPDESFLLWNKHAACVILEHVLDITLLCHL